MALPCKGNALMPKGTSAELSELDEAVDELSPAHRRKVRDLHDEVGLRDLFFLLHGMRRWYSAWTWNHAKHVHPHRDLLHDMGAMDLDAPVGAYRGIKVDARSELARVCEGQRLTLPHRRSGGCSSWAGTREIANRFSGGGKGKVGLVLQLAGKAGVETFIAPPAKSAPWFNALYAATMGRSFREKESEYALRADPLVVRVVAVKRR